MKDKSDALKEAIKLLKEKQTLELELVKEQLYITYESFKPINVVKNTLQEIGTSPDLRNGIVSNVIGLAAGYLSKKVLVGTSGNPLKKVMGYLLQIAIGNVVAKHSDGIKEKGESIIRHFFAKKDEEIEINQNGHAKN